MDNRLLEILACPICKNGLRHDRQALELICDHDHLAFPIRDGIPVMLVAEARSTEQAASGHDLPVQDNLADPNAHMGSSDANIQTNSSEARSQDKTSSDRDGKASD